MSRVTPSCVNVVVLSGEHRCESSGMGLGLVPGMPRTIRPVILSTTSPPVKERGSPRSHVSEPLPPCHCFASMLSWGPPAGRHAGGTQNVKPEARTWCHTESGVPTPGMAQGAAGAVCDERPPDAAPTATSARYARYGRVCRIGVLVTPEA